MENYILNFPLKMIAHYCLDIDRRTDLGFLVHLSPSHPMRQTSSSNRWSAGMNWIRGKVCVKERERDRDLFEPANARRMLSMECWSFQVRGQAQNTPIIYQMAGLTAAPRRGVELGDQT